jgi:hypothetical protein
LVFMIDDIANHLPRSQSSEPGASFQWAIRMASR